MFLIPIPWTRTSQKRRTNLIGRHKWSDGISEFNFAFYEFLLPQIRIYFVIRIDEQTATASKTNYNVVWIENKSSRARWSIHFVWPFIRSIDLFLNLISLFQRKSVSFSFANCSSALAPRPALWMKSMNEWDQRLEILQFRFTKAIRKSN